MISGRSKSKERLEDEAGGLKRTISSPDIAVFTQTCPNIQLCRLSTLLLLYRTYSTFLTYWIGCIFVPPWVYKIYLFNFVSQCTYTDAGVVCIS
jgi:hypothetical protein